MANKTMYKIVGRYANGKEIIGYHLQSTESNKSGRYTREQVCFFVGRGQIVNCSGQLYQDKVMLRGVGISLDALPTKQEKSKDQNINTTNSQVNQVNRNRSSKYDIANESLEKVNNPFILVIYKNKPYGIISKSEFDEPRRVCLKSFASLVGLSDNNLDYNIAAQDVNGDYMDDGVTKWGLYNGLLLSDIRYDFDINNDHLFVRYIESYKDLSIRVGINNKHGGNIKSYKDLPLAKLTPQLASKYNYTTDSNFWDTEITRVRVTIS